MTMSKESPEKSLPSLADLLILKNILRFYNLIQLATF